jgi:hypothetical protein
MIDAILPIMAKKKGFVAAMSTTIDFILLRVMSDINIMKNKYFATTTPIIIDFEILSERREINIAPDLLKQ